MCPSFYTINAFCHPWAIFDCFVHQNFLVPWFFWGGRRNRRDTWTDKLFKGNIILDSGLYWIILSFFFASPWQEECNSPYKEMQPSTVKWKGQFRCNSYRWIYESERMENQLQRTIYIEEKIWFWNWMIFSKCRSNICPGVSAP